jgi:poly(ribitol-phosphate) beta-N-acetylglucosaminyltransferase
VSSAADVTVIVAVYNTMPYLTECLTSLVDQTIRPDGMQIVVIDDGSTDGSLKEVERFAALHPGRFTVLSQPNSGGPAAPNNRGLEMATGRYVFFLGADDYLGLDALQKLVAEADHYGADVVAGKMIGVNDRYVHQEIYAATDHDVPLYNSALPWSMSNTKLFRRDLIERHHLRYPEQLAVGSDQAFTLEACVRASRISVLADDTYYFAVRRADASNITYVTPPEVHLHCAHFLVTAAARLIAAGPHRDAILRRLFTWEIYKILTVNFLELEAPRQESLMRGVAALADEFLSDALRDDLPVRRRLLLGLAQAGELATLRDVIRELVDEVVVPIVLDGGRAHLAYAGFAPGRSVVGDYYYEIIGPASPWHLANRAPVTSLEWQQARPDLYLDGTSRVGITGPGAVDAATMRVAAVDPASGGDVVHAITPTLTPAKDGPATEVSWRLSIGSVLDARPAGARLVLRLLLDVSGTTHELPITSDLPRAEQRHRHRGRLYVVSTSPSKTGRLQLVAVPLSRLARVRAQLRPLKAAMRRK